VNAKIGEGWTVLLSATCSGRGSVAKSLINAGADVNVKDDDTGRTLLHWAVVSHIGKEIIELLLAKGLDLEAKDKDGKTPIDLAFDSPTATAAELFLKWEVLSLKKSLSQLQHLIIGDDGDDGSDQPSIEKLQGVFVIRGKVGGKYEVQYHTGDNNWQVREEITLTANRQLYIDSSSYDEKGFYRVKLIE
jgi:hypothetical protein